MRPKHVREPSPMIPSAARVLLAVAATAGIAPSASDPWMSGRMRPMPGPARDAGVYHLATGTWTRKASAVSLGADIIYNNTCSTGYYNPFSGDAFIDEGRIPSPSSPDNARSKPGTATAYTIDGFQLAYCLDQYNGPGTMTFNFYDSYIACTSVIGMTPTATIAVSGLPGSGSTTGLCWLVTIDLDSSPQTASLAFTMLADGDGTYSNGSGDRFGWSQESSLPDSSLLSTGPLLQGDFNACNGYDGTAWDPVLDYTEAGTGMSTQNSFYIENGPTTPGCTWFGPSFMGIASYHLELYADAGVCPPNPGTIFCCGNGSGTACPCGNHSSQANPGNCSGCLHSQNSSGRLRATVGSPCWPGQGGSASLSADTVVLIGSWMPVNSSALYFQGTTRLAGGAGSVMGDGLRCAGGVVTRLGTKTNVGGASQYPDAGDLPISIRGSITTPGTRTYQVWYRSPAAFCTPATFNLTNGYEIDWSA